MLRVYRKINFQKSKFPNFRRLNYNGGDKLVLSHNSFNIKGESV